MFYPLISEDKLVDGLFQTFEVNKTKLLLIQTDGYIYLIENKCGHFGIALETGLVKLENDLPVIVCNEHRISFKLDSGEVSNRPYENCDPIKIYNWAIQEGMLGYIE